VICFSIDAITDCFHSISLARDIQTRGYDYRIVSLHRETMSAFLRRECLSESERARQRSTLRFQPVMRSALALIYRVNRFGDFIALINMLFTSNRYTAWPQSYHEQNSLVNGRMIFDAISPRLAAPRFNPSLYRLRRIPLDFWISIIIRFLEVASSASRGFAAIFLGCDFVLLPYQSAHTYRANGVIGRSAYLGSVYLLGACVVRSVRLRSLLETGRSLTRRKHNLDHNPSATTDCVDNVFDVYIAIVSTSADKSVIQRREASCLRLHATESTMETWRRKQVSKRTKLERRILRRESEIIVCSFSSPTN